MVSKDFELVYVECISYLNHYIKNESFINKFEIICVDTLDNCGICLCNEVPTTNTLKFLNIKVKCCSNNHSMCLKCFIKNSHSQYEQGINLSCSFCREEDIYMTPQILEELIKYINKLEEF